ncbi:hypothetical protein N6G02_11980 [Cupriavidus gilardii]|uniref:Uncharacterized protein n=1 Tax=Cupriavidus gilardii TaxID=82541 RepID=A0A849BFD7_9BURK|nr:hypothetical protein [Cupriavidus gilardii]ALD89373.1 hypothetical protein CR3_0114 [Cupriavidus gilardii CR3]QQE07047.1 hypothetical protein IC580_00645 [Cupriavidus sp. ISTL7]KAB0596681.1 hypothetical protein F7Q96_12415 [Cupriavidus gilardii]MCT9013672.1 hypothetical protein [Cupriavidus gilardii]MCT9051860.1 hypothetical protein [Cupriavidus gilardii]
MKHIGLMSAGVLAGLAGATAFLCAVPDRGEATRIDAATGDGKVKVSHAVFVSESAEYGARSNRHAFDALRVGTSGMAGTTDMADRAANGGDDLGWDYVQLRL